MTMASLAQVAAPHANHFAAKPPNGPAVGRHREVPEVPADDTTEPFSLFIDRVMPPASHRLLHGLKRHTHSLWVATSGQQKAAPTRRPASVEESEKTKRLRRAALPSPRPPRLGVAAEFDEPRLVRVQLEGELAQAFAQLAPKPLRVVLVLEAHHQIVGISHDDNVTARMPAAPSTLTKNDPLLLTKNGPPKFRSAARRAGRWRAPTTSSSLGPPCSLRGEHRAELQVSLRKVAQLGADPAGCRRVATPGSKASSPMSSTRTRSSWHGGSALVSRIGSILDSVEGRH